MVFSIILALDLLALCLFGLRRFPLLLSFKSLLRHRTWCTIDNRRSTITNRLQGTSLIFVYYCTFNSHVPYYYSVFTIWALIHEIYLNHDSVTVAQNPWSVYWIVVSTELYQVSLLFNFYYNSSHFCRWDHAVVEERKYCFETETFKITSSINIQRVGKWTLAY